MKYDDDAVQRWAAQREQEKYVKHPEHCPKCDSGRISATPDLEGGGGGDPLQVWQEITCLDCGAQWRDIYILTGFQMVEGA